MRRVLTVLASIFVGLAVCTPVATAVPTIEPGCKTASVEVTHEIGGKPAFVYVHTVDWCWDEDGVVVVTRVEGAPSEVNPLLCRWLGALWEVATPTDDAVTTWETTSAGSFTCAGGAEVYQVTPWVILPVSASGTGPDEKGVEVAIISPRG